jgi:UDP-glucose 4-epimerase
MTVMVTGGNGFIGSYVIKSLQEAGEEVVCFDIVDPPEKISALMDTGKMKFFRADIQDMDNLLRIIKENQIDRIIHTPAILAALSQRDPALAFKVNIGGTVHVLEAARMTKVKRVVFVSSHTIYGNISQAKTPEEYPKNPTTVYGVTKLTCEHFGLQYKKEFGVDFVALRFPLIYGWRAGLVKGIPIFSEIIEKSWRGEPMILKLTGGLGRKFLSLYVKDAAKAILLAAFKGELKSPSYNIGSGEILSIEEILEIVEQLMPKSKVTVIEGEDGATLVEGSLDLSRAAKELGYKPDYSFQEGVKDYMTYLG